MEKKGKCFDCDDEGTVYEFIHNGPNGDEKIDLCKKCYIAAVCVEKCEKGFCSEGCIIGCLLQPTGETDVTEYSDEVPTYNEVVPSKCPKNMLDILIDLNGDDNAS
jgi:hypothetical protein